MKVKMIVSMAGRKVAYNVHDIIDMDDKQAQALIKASYADKYTAAKSENKLRTAAKRVGKATE